VELGSNPIQTEAPPPPHRRIRQEDNQPDPRSVAAKDHELLSAVRTRMPLIGSVVYARAAAFRLTCSDTNGESVGRR
jgi:hypothetical protein